VPAVTVIEDEKYNGHILIIENFADAILYGTPLLSPGEEAISELTISNAAYLSAWTGERIKLPMDDNRFYDELCARRESSVVKRSAEKEQMSNSEYSSRWNTNW
jgi:hypothetical protein